MAGPNPTHDPTHDPARKSWLAAANDPSGDFPIQNLPYGCFATDADPTPRLGVAIGDAVLDLAPLAAAGLIPLAAEACTGPSALNAVMARGPETWTALRRALSDLLSDGATGLADDGALKARALVPLDTARLRLPFAVTEFTDFYASREHATNVGRLFRDPDKALMANWLHLPVGYNGRASSVVVSGTDVRRPCGQTKAPDAHAPAFGPSAKLDIELEMGAVVGTGSALGSRVSVAEAEAMIFGYVLLNDWSARDIQVWEYQPLGPFQAKAFATTISPWVVTADALAPFRVAGPVQDPAPLAYLRQDGPRNLDIHLRVSMQAPDAAAATVISRTNFKHMYWSSAQQLAHHASSGCAMRTGDLLGSGTISGPTPDSLGSLLEMTLNGIEPLALDDGSTRTFIQDGDTLVLSGHAEGDGYRIGFGEARGTVCPALA